MSPQLFKASVLMLQPSFPLCPDALVCFGDQREFPDPSTKPCPALREECYEEGRDGGGAWGDDQRLRRQGLQGATLTNVNTPAPSTAYTAWSQGTCGADTKWA